MTNTAKRNMMAKITIPSFILYPQTYQLGAKHLPHERLLYYDFFKLWAEIAEVEHASACFVNLIDNLTSIK